MNEELDTLAAEYVLGTLPADERAQVDERLRHDADLREAVHLWERRLSPLAEESPAEEPRAEVWRNVEAAVARLPGARGADNVVPLRRKLAFWRGATAVTGALAAALAIFVLTDRAALPPAGGRYIAVVDSGGDEPALIAAVDTNTGTIRIRRLTAEAPAGHSLELWHTAEGHEPRSLGVLQAGLDELTIQDAAASGALEGAIAVSVEPAGGSPTGQPTGPVVYSGRLIAVD